MSEPSPFTRDTPRDHDGSGAEGTEDGGGASSPKRRRKQRKRKRRLRRAIVWSLVSLVLLLLVILGGSLFTLARLDNPTISGLLRDRLAAGYDLDVTYDALSIDVLGGLHAENLRLRTPAPYTEHAPYLLQIARVDATWDFWSLVAGEPRLGKIDVEGVTVAVVVDEHGGSSLIELARRFPPSEEEPAVVPLSHVVKDSLPALAVDALSVRDVGMELLQIQENQVQRRVALTGVCLGGPFQARPGALTTELRLGSCDQGLEVSVIEPGAPDPRPRKMLVNLEHQVTTPAPDRVQIAIRGQLVRQDLVPEVALPEQVIVARAGVRFDPAAQRTHVALDELRLLDGVLTAEAQVVLDDRDGGATAATIEHLAGRLDGNKLAALAPGLLGGVTLADTALTYEVTELAIDAASGLPTRGKVAVRGDLGSVRVDRDGQKLAVDQAHLAFDLELPPQTPQPAPAPPGALGGTLLGKLRSSLRVERLDADMAGQRASVQKLEVALAGDDLALDVGSPQASRGTLTLTAALAGAGAVLPDAQAELGALRMNAEITAGDVIQARGELPLEAVSLTQRGGARVRGRDMSLSFRVGGLDPNFARPADIQADARVGKLDVADAGQTVAISDARAKIRASVRSPTAFDARVELPVAAVDVRAPDGVTLALRDLGLDVRLDDMVLGDEALPRGHVAVASTLPRLSARTPTTTAEGRDLGLTAEARLTGGGPLTLSGTLPVGKLELRDTTPGAPASRMDLGGARLAWRVEDLVMHPTDPLRTRGRVHVEGAVPELQVPGERMFVAVPRLVLDATLHGARKAYDAKLRMSLRTRTQRGKGQKGAELVAGVDAHADLRAPAMRLRFDVRAPEAGDDAGDDAVILGGHFHAGFAAAQRRLSYDVALRAERLAVIDDLLPSSVRDQHRIDWSALRVRVDGRGEVRDLIQRVIDGEPVLADDALTALRGEQELTVDVQGLDYRGDGQRVQIPGLTLALSGARKDDAAHARIDLRLPRMALESEEKTIEVADLVHRVDISSPGALETSRLTVAVDTEIGKVTQPFIGYPVEKAKFTLRGHVDHLASLQVQELAFDNPAGGTHLSAVMAVDQPVVDTGAIPGRQALTLSGTLRQDLGRISLGPNSPRVRGRVSLPFQVESGDLSAFLVGLRAEVDDVHVAIGLPGTGIAVQGLTGRIPVLVEVALLPGGGVRILEGPAKNLYSRTRFLDVHPFLRGEHFLSIDKVWFMDDAIGPIAGNLRVERDSLSLDQLQLGFMGGNVTGQLVVDYGNGKPRVMFRGSATGLRPGKDSKEVLDANAALVFSPDPLALEGRMQVIRMSRQHLLAMLDIIDPFHEDPDFNKVRLGLRVGHPKFLRLRMKDGFLDAKIELGGAANLIRIDEIRGVALGPLLNLYVAPYLTPDPALAPPKEDETEDAAAGDADDDDAGDPQGDPAGEAAPQ